MKYRKTSLVAMITAAISGVMIQSAQADPGTIHYTNWSWSLPVPEFGKATGTPFHYEGGGYSGISAEISFRDFPEVGGEKIVLQRNLSWAGDGWVTIATVGDGISNFRSDDKRYFLRCGYYIAYRVKDQWGDISQTSPIYAGQGASGEHC